MKSSQMPVAVHGTVTPGQQRNQEELTMYTNNHLEQLAKLNQDHHRELLRVAEQQRLLGQSKTQPQRGHPLYHLLARYIPQRLHVLFSLG
jgi:hypothetical protein